MDSAASLVIAGEARKLRFDWSALAEFRALFGPDFQDRINRDLVQLDFSTMALAVSVGTGGKITPEEVIKSSPPIVETIKALNQAFTFAYHGPPSFAEKAIRRPLEVARSRVLSILSAMRSSIG